MRHRKRLDRLAVQLRTAATDRARRVSYRSCLGMNNHEVAEAVAATVTEETAALFEEVISQAHHYAEHGRLAPDGSRHLHGFIQWAWRYLPLGWSSLPAKMPTAWLTAWTKGYIAEVGWDKTPVSPQPHVRCESCFLVHPNRDADGEWGGPSKCAACGGTDFSCQQMFDMRLFSRDGGRTRFAADAWTGQ
jgi:hypothetical protein